MSVPQLNELIAKRRAWTSKDSASQRESPALISSSSSQASTSVVDLSQVEESAVDPSEDFVPDSQRDVQRINMPSTSVFSPPNLDSKAEPEIPSSLNTGKDGQ